MPQWILTIPAFEQEEEPLQDAELYLLSKIDYNGSSP
jgi:hypothetical protein